MRTLILDISFSRIFRAGPILRAGLNVPAVIYNGVKGAPPPLDSFDRLVVSGSEASILTDDDWIVRQGEFLARAVDAKKKILGICFGHQLLARALWGKSAVSKCPSAEFGWRQMEVDNSDPLFAGLPRRSWLYCSHFDQVAALGPGARTLADSADCGIQAFRLDGRPIWGVQFHPEFHGFVAVAILLKACAQTPLARLSLAQTVSGLRQIDWGKRILANFVDTTS